MKLGCWSKEIAFLLPVLLKQTKNHFFLNIVNENCTTSSSPIAPWSFRMQVFETNERKSDGFQRK